MDAKLDIFDWQRAGLFKGNWHVEYQLARGGEQLAVEVRSGDWFDNKLPLTVTLNRRALVQLSIAPQDKPNFSEAKAFAAVCPQCGNRCSKFYWLDETLSCPKCPRCEADRYKYMMADYRNSEKELDRYKRQLERREFDRVIAKINGEPWKKERYTLTRRETRRRIKKLEYELRLQKAKIWAYMSDKVAKTGL